jgi:predicted DNA-binding transcriptional regulator AlpA
MIRNSTPPNTPGQLQDSVYWEGLVSERQAADFLGVTVRALQKWRVTGTGPTYVRISSRCIRYRRRDLHAWIEARVRSSTTE